MDIQKLDDLIARDQRAVALMHGTQPERNIAPFADLEVARDEVAMALRRNRCAVIRPKQPAYTAGNSLVYCGPDIFISELFTGEDVRVAMTTVIIYGHLDEELHHHTSHVFSYVIEGRGWLYTEADRLEAGAGDLVVIPRGVRHLFNCDEEQRMLIFAMEISDKLIDHQKNFYR